MEKKVIKLSKKKINRLLIKLKNSEKDESTKNENLEEEIKEETKEIQTEQFQEFMRSTGKLITPILESNPRQNLPIEQEISTTPTPENRETRTRNYGVRNTTDYISRTTTENLEKRYESKIETPILRQRENLARTAQFIDPIEQMNLSEKENMRPRFIGAEFLEHERNLPFERENRKYKKTRG